MQQIETLQKIIKEKGVSIANISKESTIKQDRLYKWLKGRGKPKADDAKLLEKWINKQLEEIPNVLNDSGDHVQYGKIKLKATDPEFFALILKEMAAMKAAIKVLTLEVVESKTKGAGNKSSLTKVTLEMEEMLNKHAEQILIEWKNELS